MNKLSNVIKLDRKDFDYWNRLLKLEKVNSFEPYGLNCNDTTTIAETEFQDGIQAEVNICTEMTCAWCEVWWRDKDGTLIDCGLMFHSLDDRHDFYLPDNDTMHFVSVEAI